MVILIIFICCGIFSSFIAPYDPQKGELMDALTPPFWQEGGTTAHVLGTDHLGRDELSRLIGGASISLQVGLTVVILAGGMGTIIGMVAGYSGGWVDAVLMRATDIMLSLPYLTIAIVLAAVIGPSLSNLILVLVIIGWASYARIIRSEVLRVKEQDFIRLAIIAGASRIRIMVKHVFPNIVNTLTVLATIQLGSVIIMEATLSFLGLGVPPPDPAWGSMLADGRQFITFAWWLCVWPGLAIMLVVLSCNLLGDWLRVRLDPKFRQI
ncbi:MAG: ABC transporter permease [Dehalococcoidales bacterium]|nr:ABC transporter permease [Dehalococcoidales bacterium]